MQRATKEINSQTSAWVERKGYLFDGDLRKSYNRLEDILASANLSPGVHLEVKSQGRKTQIVSSPDYLAFMIINKQIGYFHIEGFLQASDAQKALEKVYAAAGTTNIKSLKPVEIDLKSDYTQPNQNFMAEFLGNRATTLFYQQKKTNGTQGRAVGEYLDAQENQHQFKKKAIIDHGKFGWNIISLGDMEFRSAHYFKPSKTTAYSALSINPNRDKDHIAHIARNDVVALYSKLGNPPLHIPGVVTMYSSTGPGK